MQNEKLLWYLIWMGIGSAVLTTIFSATIITKLNKIESENRQNT